MNDDFWGNDDYSYRHGIYSFANRHQWTPDELLKLPIKHGGHSSDGFKGQTCAVEKACVVATLIPELRQKYGAAERFGDDHPSICPLIREAVIYLNDAKWENTEARTAALDPLVLKILGTKVWGREGDRAATVLARRKNLFRLRGVREELAAVLEAVEMGDLADLLWAKLPASITTCEEAHQATAVLKDVLETVKARNHTLRFGAGVPEYAQFRHEVGLSGGDQLYGYQYEISQGRYGCPQETVEEMFTYANMIHKQAVAHARLQAAIKLQREHTDRTWPVSDGLCEEAMRKAQQCVIMVGRAERIKTLEAMCEVTTESVLREGAEASR